MSRIQQLNPNDYTANEQINADFSQIYSYLQAAELGNLTIAELMAKIFNASGNVKSTFLQFRWDDANGIMQYRMANGDWANVTGATLAELQGAPGASGNGTGDMVRATYDPNSDGKIAYAQLAIADGDLPQAKVADLEDDLQLRMVGYIQDTEPVSPTYPPAGPMTVWFDNTDPANPVLKVWDGISAWPAISATINMASNRILGRTTGGAGTVEELQAGIGITLSSGQIKTSGMILNHQQVFSGNGTFTPAAGVTRVFVEVWGAGGGGGGAGTTNCQGPGGGAGGYSAGFVDVTPTVGCAVVVGTGGASSTTGGNSSFAGASVTLTGNAGVGGTTAAAADTLYNGGVGGTATGGDLNITGGAGSPVRVVSGAGQVNYGNGGNSPRGGLGGQGALSVSSNVGGFAGVTPGGGGGGAARQGGSGTAAGGVGGDGRVIVWYP